MLTVYKELRLRAKTEGDLGIEIEVEGKNLPNMTKYWRNEHDGSLRGEENKEYVLRTPGSLEEVKKALDYLEAQWVKNNTRIDDTVRAGVHVHVNCQKLTMVELYNFFTVYLIVEELLIKYCGKYREGNLFCLRAKDADYILSAIRTAAQQKSFRNNFHTDTLRYAAMNVKALGDYGSLEFRSMRSTRDLNVVYKWAEILLGLREVSKTFESPQHIVESFSFDGPDVFLKKVFGENLPLLTDGVDNIHERLYSGVRLAQDIAYNIDWQKWNEKGRIIGGLEFSPDLKIIDEPEEDW